MAVSASCRDGFRFGGTVSGVRCATGFSARRRGEVGNVVADKIACGQLLDDLLEHADANIKASTAKVWRLVIDACDRELSILRTALNLGRKSTPPKVEKIPYFPMKNEDGKAGQGFLTDEECTKLRDALPDCLNPLFVTASFTGVRVGELFRDAARGRNQKRLVAR